MNQLFLFLIINHFNKPFTESSTKELVYIGQTAEAKPIARPKRALIVKTYQKLETRIAKRGNIIPMIDITIKDYIKFIQIIRTVRIPHLLEIQTPIGEPIVAKTRIEEVKRPYSINNTTLLITI